MKKATILSILFVYASALFGQTNIKVLTSSEILWAGLDFSKARMIGSDGFTDPGAIVNDFFDKWNQLILMESDKYDIAKAYQKAKVNNDLSVAERQNSTVDPGELVINSPYRLSDQDIDAIVKNYRGLKDESGVGLVYIVEYFSKLDKEGSIFVVFFDLDSQEILNVRNYKTKPSGFGLRNYWANTVYETIKASGKDFKKALK